MCSRGVRRFGHMNVLAFLLFLAYIAFSLEIAILRLKEGKKGHECENQTLCDLERWV
jgi:hypothetical protein